MPGEPFDYRADEFFKEPYGYVLSPKEMEDEEAATRQHALFGAVMWPLLSLLLVTNRRLLWKPLDALKKGGRKLRYATYEEGSMAQRHINRECVSRIDPIRLGDIIRLPSGLSSESGIQVACTADDHSCSGCVQGPSWPAFNLKQVKEFEGISEGREGSLFLYATGNPHAADTFLYACARAGFPVEPKEMIDGMSTDPRFQNWMPLYERLG